MIVRILGDGQFRVPESGRDALEALDGNLVTAVEAHDEGAFAKALGALVQAVRTTGEAVPHDEPAPSDLVVPYPDATLAETEQLLADATDAGSDAT